MQFHDMNTIHTDYSNRTSKGLSPTLQRVMTRLSGLAEKYFTVRLELIGSAPKPDASPGERSLEIIKNGQTWGWLKAHGLQSDRDQERLEQMVDLLLTPTLEHEDTYETLDKLEEQMNLELTPQNVIRLDAFRSPRQKSREAAPAHLVPTAPRRSSQRSVFLSHPDEEQRFRQAKIFHDEYGGYAFLPIEDLETELFNSVEEFILIGDVTVYVSEVTQLTAPMQDFIAKAMCWESADPKPHFVMGSELSIYNSKLELLVTPALLALLKKSARPESFLFL